MPRTTLAGRPGHNRGRTYPPEVLSPEEVERLVGAASARSSTGIRARALILTLQRGGLRLGEALALYPRDVDLARGTIRILRGRGDKARTVAIDPGAAAAIGRWLDRRAHLGIGRRRPLFCTLAGTALYPQQVRATLTRLGERAGIDKRVHPHGLRHAHAAHLDRSGVPITTIVRQLGHANLAVTSRYLQSLGQDEHLARVQTINWQSP
ncbi:MAG TPA: site-specific integrase [Acidimicrobiales bacterium]